MNPPYLKEVPRSPDAGYRVAVPVSSATDLTPPAARFASLAKVLDAIVFLGLLAVMILAAVVYGTVDAWWEAVFECLVFTLTAVWVLEGLLRGHWGLQRTIILLPLLSITIYAFVQILPWPATWFAQGSASSGSSRILSIDRYQTYLTAVKLLALTLFVGLLLIHTSTPKRFRWLVRAVIALGCASAVFGILRQFLQSPESTSGFGLTFLFYGVGYGQFISPNAFAYLMEMTFGLLAGLILGGGVPRNRILIYIAVAFVVWTALVLSNSRGGILSLGCQSVFVLFVSLNWYSSRQLAKAQGRQRRWITFIQTSMLARVLAAVLVLGALGVGVVWIGGELLANKVVGLTPVPGERTIDDPTRREIWRASWNLFKQNPWTGVGFGNYFLGIPQFEQNSGRIRLEQAHNDYLDLAASGGIVGLALVCWFLGAVVWRARRIFRSREVYQRAAALGAASAVLGIAIHSFLDFGLQLTGIAVVFAAIIVILLAPRMKTTPSRHHRSEPTVG